MLILKERLGDHHHAVGIVVIGPTGDHGQALIGKRAYPARIGLAHFRWLPFVLHDKLIFHLINVGPVLGVQGDDVSGF